MTRTLRKSLFRDIRQSFTRFIAIFVITALGACFFAGLRATGPDMRRTADRYFTDTKLMDYSLLSTVGFTQQDVQALRNLDGIAAVMPAQQVDLMVSAGDQDIAARFYSLPDSASSQAMNLPQLVQGRLPEEPGECAVGGSLFWRNSFAGLGETLTVTPDNDASSLGLLERRSFKVVGIVESPLYVSNMLGTTSVGSGTLTAYVYLPMGDFDNTYYTELFARDADTQGLSAFSAAYGQIVDAGISRLEDFGKDRAELRYDDIKVQAQSELNAALDAYGQAQADSQERLDAAKAQLDAAADEIADKGAALEEAKQQLQSGSAQLDESKRQLDETKSQLDATKTQLDAAKSQLDATKSQLDATKSRLDAAKAQLDTEQAAYDTQLQAYESGLAAYTQRRAEWDAAYAALNPDDPGYGEALSLLEEALPVLDATKAQLDAAKTQLDAAKTQLDAGWTQYNSGMAQYDSGFAQYSGSLDQYNSGLAQYNSGMAQYGAGRDAYSAAAAKLSASGAQAAEGERELAAARQQLSDGQAAYGASESDAKAQLAAAAKKIGDGEQALNTLAVPAWYVFGRDNNSGYPGFGSDADRVGAIASVLPVFFLLVAALVCLTTMTRMVEEQRTQIGMLKAQGFSKFSIAAKYVAYAAAASASGAVCGTAVGVVLFPSTIWHAYQILYQMRGLLLGGNGLLIAVTLLIAVLVTTVSALAACLSSLSAVPAELMRPKAPAKGKRVLLEHIPFLWRRLKFSQKVTVRNLLRSPRRFLMTVVGVLGCTALLLAGLGLRNAIEGIASYQFGVIQRYDAMVALTAGSSAAADTSLNTLLQGKAGALYMREESVTAESGKVSHTDLGIQLYVPEDPAALPDFFRLADRKTQEPISIPGLNGAVLTEKLARTLQVSVGDEITVHTTQTDGSDKTAVLTVSGIAENYVYHLIFISPQTYERDFGGQSDYNVVLLRLDQAAAADRQTFLGEVVADQTVTGLLDIQVLKDNVGDMLQSMNAVVWLIIVSAGALAFVVLFNLININITEREREIATLKVLGFYDREVRRTVYRENRILTLIGIALGLVGGVFLSRYITSVAEVDEVMFRRDIQPLSYLLSVAFTVLCAELVNLLMRRRLREIDMVGSLKSAE